MGTLGSLTLGGSMHKALSWSLTVFIPLSLGCSSPTFQEACSDYCESAKSAHCGSTLPAECTTGCKQMEAQLKGKCVDEYTDLMDCAAGSDFQCVQGTPVATGEGCTDEAIDLANCLGVLKQ